MEKKFRDEMKNKFFACLLYFTATIHSSEDIEIKARITIAQILATPFIPLFIGGKSQNDTWIELVVDLIDNMEKLPNFETLEKPTITLIKSTLLSGFKPQKYAISEQALVTVMFFIHSINKNRKTIQTFVTDKTYSIGNFATWKAMQDHFVFAKLVARQKIACSKVNHTPVYHPMNFDYEDVPLTISKIARAYGPFFQDISLRDELKKETGNSLMKYAHTLRDPRSDSGNKALVFFKFPDHRLNLNC